MDRRLCVYTRRVIKFVDTRGQGEGTRLFYPPLTSRCFAVVSSLRQSESATMEAKRPICTSYVKPIGDHGPITRARRRTLGEPFGELIPGDREPIAIPEADAKLEDVLARKDDEILLLKKKTEVLQLRLNSCITRLLVYELAGGFDLIAPKYDQLKKTLGARFDKKHADKERFETLESFVDEFFEDETDCTLHRWRGDDAVVTADTEL